VKGQVTSESLRPTGLDADTSVRHRDVEPRLIFFQSGRQGIAPCKAGFGIQPDPRSRPMCNPPAWNRTTLLERPRLQRGTTTWWTPDGYVFRSLLCQL